MTIAALMEHFYPEFIYAAMITAPFFRHQVHQLAQRREKVLVAFLKDLQKKNSNIPEELLRVLQEDYIPDGFDFSNVLF